MKRREPSIAKITRPSAKGIFPRERLFHLLDRRRDFPIIWVSGPPGSGKTSLVASYLDSLKLPSLWYQIDERDTDIASFFYYTGMAARRAASKKRKPLPLLTSEYLKGIPAFTRHFFEDLYTRFKTSFILVFDNYQRVPLDSGFHEMILHGLDVIPEGVNVFVLSRNEPPPQLTRLLANNKIDFLERNEIQFTVEETREILRTKGQRELTHEIVVELHKKTGGWAAGLVLIALGSRIRTIDDEFMSRFPTKEIFDYFGIEIFEKMGKETQEFLLKTSFFPRMTAQMAEKLTGIANSGRILSCLSEDHYFTEKYSEDNPVYEYHPLFKEFLSCRAERLFASDEISTVRRDAAVILEESGRMESAAALFRAAKDWDGLIRLILSQAQALITQGRNRTLEEWIVSIPEMVRESMPWLLYWLGTCKQPFSSGESRVLFEQAFQRFQREENATGTLLAWSGAVDTIVYEWNDFALLDHWIEWLDERLQRDSSFPSLEIEARVASSMAGTLLYRQPYHPDIKKWMERALSLCQEAGEVSLHMKANLYAVNYYAWVGDLSNCNLVADEIRKIAQLPTSSPPMVLTWKWIEALIYNRTIESTELSLKSISEGLKIAKKNGVHVWDHMLLAQGVYASLNKGDLAMAEEFLKKMEVTLEKNRRHGLCQYHYLAAWYNLLAKNISLASSYAESALSLADETGTYFTKILCSLLTAQVLYEKEEYQKAASQLSLAKELICRSGSVMLEYMCLIKEAQFAIDRGAVKLEKRGLEALRRSMELGRKHGYAGLFPWWQRSVMARLCAKALVERIEVDYVQDLIRKHHLIPDDPAPDIEDWPWPLKIYTLGEFELIKDGRPVWFSGKVQKKPLEMLKALIASGGREVTEGQIAESLWPDADGDAAHSASKMTLSRLRQLLGIDRVIRFQEGRATLDPRYCWIDVWAFERVAGQAEALWNSQSKDDATEAVRLTEKALSIYKGHFLPADVGHFWTVSCRERLRKKCLRLAIRFGGYLEQTRQWKKAVEHYQRSLEIDDLAEELYQHLMVCHQRLGQYVEAIEAYRRLKKTLSSALGTEPSPKTEEIYKTLIGSVKIQTPNRAPK